MQTRSVYGGDYTDHQVDGRQLVLGGSEPISDDPLYPIPGAGPRHGLFADDQTQSGVVHSIENQVQT